MSTLPPGPDQTYAFVVGIDKYDAGDAWGLHGPAEDARSFASWLLNEGVPPGNIQLYISPLDQNSAVAGLVSQPATRDNIYRGLTVGLRDVAGQLLYFFWAGHGMMSTENARRLLYADATQETKLNLDFNSLLSSLRTTYFQGFPQQVFLVDACANYVPDLGVKQSLPVELFPYGQQPLKPRDQFVLFAATAGDVANNADNLNAGLFSQVVIEELKKAAGTWPPDMSALAQQVEQRFTQLQTEGKTHQTPTYYWYRGQSDVEGSIGNPPPEQPAQPSADTMTFAQIKANALQVQWKALIEDYEAANNQLTYVRDATDAHRLRRQLEDLSTQIEAIEQEKAKLK